MPNLTTGFPRRTGDAQKDYEYLYDWAVSLVDELKAILCNLDSGNVSEAASVKAQNIDVSQAKIKDAQITSLTADKLTAGTIDAEEIDVININADNIKTGTLDAGNVTIESNDTAGTMKLDGDSLVFEEGKDDNAVIRIALGRLDTGEYIFIVQNREKTKGIRMDETGNFTFTGDMVGGNIDIKSEAKIGKAIILRDADESTGGYEEAVTINVQTGAVNIMAENSRRIAISTGGRMDISCGSLWVNNEQIR